MEVLDCIKTRFSCRAFLPKRVPKSVVKKILQAAGRSPSYTNTQPWEVAVVSGKKLEELKDLLLKLAKAKAPGAADIPKPSSWPAALDQRAHEHGARRLATLGVARDDAAGREVLRLGNFSCYGAPCAVFLLVDASLGEYSLYDLGLFTQSLILSAHSLGVESCIQASVVDYAPQIKKCLGIPSGKKLMIGIAMGYADQKAVLNNYRSRKQKADDFTRWCE